MRRDGRPALEHPVVRQRLAEIAGYVATQEWAVARMLTAIHRGRDAEVMSEMLTAKLFGTNLQQMITKLALDLIPEEGLREPDPDDVGDEHPALHARPLGLAVHVLARRRDRAAAPRTCSATSSASTCSAFRAICGRRRK